jgi:DNA-binding MarR family transcriptional regulator
MYMHLIGFKKRMICAMAAACADMDVDTAICHAMPSSEKVERVIPLPCACASLRRAARAVTQFYDAEMRGSGLRVTQFTLLQALSIAPGISQKQLAELLEIDSTTLTRTLAHLRRKRWLRSETGTDRREIRLFLTPGGQREFSRVLPYWQSAQRRLRQAWGEANWQDVANSAMLIAQLTPKPD